MREEEGRRERARERTLKVPTVDGTAGPAVGGRVDEDEGRDADIDREEELRRTRGLEEEEDGAESRKGRVKEDMAVWKEKTLSLCPILHPAQCTFSRDMLPFKIRSVVARSSSVHQTLQSFVAAASRRSKA